MLVRRLAIAASTVAVLVATGLAGAPSALASPPSPATTTKVPGASAHPVEGAASPRSSTSADQPSADLPTGSFSGIITGAASSVGDSGIAVARRNGQSKASITDETAKVALSILSAAQARQHGFSGLTFAVTSTGGSSIPVDITVPRSLLDRLYGADYAGRIRWVASTNASTATPTRRGTIASSDIDTTSTERTTPLGSSNSKSASTVRVSAAKSTTFVAAAGAPVSSTGTGSFAATPLSAASTWDVSAQTGDFSWSYDIRTPPAAAGATPDLSLNYDSQAVDGESGSTNNQPSAIGDGWSLGGGGFIERSYVPCSQDTSAVASSGDQCWKTDNATISFGGHSGRLVRDSSSGAWKLQSDDGSRIEHLAGTGQGCAANGTYDADCWRVTTTDGTQYWFGLNQLPGWTTGKPTTNSAWTVPVFGNDAGEPCHGSTFAASSCQQGWRWNLDYVVDVHGNAQALYYNAETNSYAVNGTTATSYTRGGQLDHIDYGFAAGNAYAANAASAKASFGYATKGRCSDASGNGCTTQSLNGPATAPATPANYPDVPFDQHCTTGCSGLISPTFWTTAMLTGISTSVLKSGAYQQVDSWTLGHSFPDPGDTTKPVLWLTKIGHTGTAGGSIAEPDTVFTGIPMQNRVWVKDGLAPLDKYRISSIQTSLGAIISVNYSGQECTPANAAAIQADLPNNNHRCFPQWWTPQVAYPAAPQLDLFHKYVVTSVVADPRTGGGQDQPQETDYLYTGTPAWRYDTSPLTPDNKRTWSQYAGYDTIEIREGAASTPSQQVATQYSFFRGMDGDRASTSGGTKTVYVNGSSTVRDSLWFAGQARQTKKLTSVGGTALMTTVATPWASDVTANDGTIQARIVQIGDTTTTSTTSTGATRTNSVTATFDATSGLELTSRDAATGTPTTCTVTSYAPNNTTAWLIGLESEKQIVAVDCNALASAVYPAAAISDIKTSYDGLAWGATPTKGDATTTQAVKKYTGTTASTAQWFTTAQTAYDSMGRATSSTDALNRTDSTAYTPAAGAAAGSGGLTSMVATNALGWTSTTILDPAWGVQTKLTDANGSITTATYDALGRVTGVWYPDNLQTDNPTQPNAAYAYSLAQNAANVVQTDALTPSAIVSSYALYDGLGRAIQTQAPAEGSGSVVTDRWYDTLGRNWSSNNAYWAPVTPSGTQFVPSTQSQVPSQIITSYDGAGRTTSTALNSLGAERYRTSYAFQGTDRVDTTPPTGGTPTTDITDARGNRTSLIQYLASSISPTAPKQTTTYGYDARGNMTSMTDPAGNAWSWSFDVLNRQVSSTDPDSGSTGRVYDDANNLTSTTDARGITVNYVYDALNRKKEQRQAVSGGTALLASWSFDSIKKGQLSSSTSYVGSTATANGAGYVKSVGGYDAQYNPTSTTISIPTGAAAFGGTSYTTTIGYTRDGSLATTIYPAMGGLASERVRYSYGGLGRLSSVGTYDLVSYTPLGQPSQDHSTKVQDIYRGYGYDQANGRVTSIVNTSLSGSASTNLSTTSYNYDDIGNLTKQATTSDSASTDTQCFKYDYLTVLTQAFTPSSGSCATTPTAAGLGGPAPYWIDYSVAAATGNRLSTVSHATSGTTTTSSYSYPASGAIRPHATTQVQVTGGSNTTTAYSYDVTGNTITRGAGTLSWDAVGKASSVTQGSSTQSNVYDADGSLLLQSESSGQATLYLGNAELRKAAGTGSITATRTYLRDSVPIAERSNVSGSEKVTWLLSDTQHTVTGQVADDTATLTVRRQDPFGVARDGSPDSWTSGHGFLNGTRSALSGLTQLGARLYDASLGRFVSVDPVLSPFTPQQNDGYAYGANAPTNNTDPDGTCFGGISGDAIRVITGCGKGPASSSVAANSARGSAGAPPAAGTGTNSKTGAKSKSTPLFVGKCDGPLKDASCPRSPSVPASANRPTGPSYDELHKDDWQTYAFVLAVLACLRIAGVCFGEVGAGSAAGARAAAASAEKAAARGVTSGGRLAQDAAVNPVAPRALPLNRPVSSSPTQNAAVQNRIADLQARGATNFRVNQQQVNFSGTRVGTNRPDLQYNLNGKRYYEEYDVPSSNRGVDHQIRIESNDPDGIVQLFTVP